MKIRLLRIQVIISQVKSWITVPDTTQWTANPIQDADEKQKKLRVDGAKNELHIYSAQTFVDDVIPDTYIC